MMGHNENAAHRLHFTDHSVDGYVQAVVPLRKKGKLSLETKNRSGSSKCSMEQSETIFFTVIDDFDYVITPAIVLAPRTATAPTV